MAEVIYDLEEYKNEYHRSSKYPRVRKETLDIPGSPEKSSIHFEIEEKEELKYSEELPPIPLGRCCTSIFFFIAGIALIVIGFVQEVKSLIPAAGLPFWVVGALILIPASYCVYELTRALMARTPLERIQILNDIPEI